MNNIHNYNSMHKAQNAFRLTTTQQNRKLTEELCIEDYFYLNNATTFFKLAKLANTQTNWFSPNPVFGERATLVANEVIQNSGDNTSLLYVKINTAMCALSVNIKRNNKLMLHYNNNKTFDLAYTLTCINYMLTQRLSKIQLNINVS